MGIERKKHKRIFVALCIVAGVISIFLWLSRFYFYGKYNTHSHKAIGNHISCFYEKDHLEITDKSFEHIKINDKKHMNLYGVKVVASDGMEFMAYEIGYSNSKFGGDFNGDDYTNVRDSYFRELAHREGLTDLEKYEVDFYQAVISNQPDYIFNVTDENFDEVCGCIEKILSEGMSQYKLDVWFEVYSEGGLILTSSKLVKVCERECVDKSDLGEFVREYIYSSVNERKN